MKIASTILDSIGNTPIVELSNIVPPDSARVIVKMESHNPTGSMKDRMALAVINGGISRGKLSNAGNVIEYTGGSTGTSLAFVCGVKGIKITIVTSDAFSLEKRNHMRALGADVIEIPSEGGRTTKELIKKMISKAKELSVMPNSFFADQFNNSDAASGYELLAEEFWSQSENRLDAFVQSVGTAQCITGVSNILRRRNSNIKIIGVEPAESPVLSGGMPGPHKIEGVGPGFVPPIWKQELTNEILQVSTDDAKEMARKLAKEEGLFGGTSTGANVIAALKIAKQMGSGKTVGTILCDSGLKYLSSDLFSSEHTK